MTTFEVGKKYHKAGDIVSKVWLCVAIHEGKPVLIHRNERDAIVVGEAFFFQWSEHKEPVTVEGWVNVYDPPLRDQSIFFSKEDAVEVAKIITRSPSRKLIATVYVKGTSDAP